MVVSLPNDKKQAYIPTPLEARALMEVGKDWRFYPSKEHFDKTVLELQQTEISLPSGEKTNAWFAARANVAIAFGKIPESYDAISIENAEKKIISDKNLWNKIQAMHLYNSAGFRPILKNPTEIKDVSVILDKISEQLNKIERGQFADGKYIPSKAEKNILRTLKNYGRFIRNPKNESEIADFTKHINNAFTQITKRDDYQIPSERKGKEKLPRKETTMSDTKDFTLNEEQLEFCKAHDIDTKTITSEEAYKAAVEKVGRETSEKEAPKAEKEATNVADDKKQKPLSVSVNEAEPEEKTNAEGPEWIKRKAEYYQKLSDDGKIQGYERDTEQQGFAAKFENAEVHYSSPDNVNVSPDAGFKVFDAMFKEPDNQGRPIEFPENASKEVATRMYAACVLNGNPMQGAVPKEIDMEELAKCGLTKEQIEQVKQFYGKNQQQENNQENPHTNSEKQISQKAQEDIKKLTEIRNNFNQMKEDGKIAIQTDEQGKPQIVAGEKGSDEDVNVAKEIMQQAAELIKAGREINNQKSASPEKQDTNEAYRQQQIENLRARLSPEQNNEHQERQENRDLIHAARLGIAPEGAKVTDHNGKEVTTKTGEDLKKYQAQLSSETMSRLTNKFGKGRA